MTLQNIAQIEDVARNLCRLEMLGIFRYVGVVWFHFHVFQVLSIRFIQQNSCCIRKSTMKHMQNRISNWNSSDLVVVIGSACLLIS
jgi:hypothetical protein